MAYHQRNGWQSCQACCRAVVKGMDMKPTNDELEAMAMRLDRKTPNMIEAHAQMEDAAATLRALSAALEAANKKRIGAERVCDLLDNKRSAAEAERDAALGVIRECILELDELGAVTVPKRARAFLARHQKETGV